MVHLIQLLVIPFFFFSTTYALPKPRHGNGGHRCRPAVSSNIFVPTYALSKTQASATAVSSLSLESSISTASTVSTSSITVLPLSTDTVISTDSTISTSPATTLSLSAESALSTSPTNIPSLSTDTVISEASTAPTSSWTVLSLSAQSTISTESTVLTSSVYSTTTSAGKVTQTTSEESTSESTSISLAESTSVESTSAPTTTSELSSVPTSSLQTTTESTSISEEITTTSEISSTSTTSTQGGPPAVFTPNPKIGPGGSTYQESEHFRVYGPGNANKTLDLLEGEYDCLVNTLGWRSPGLSNYVEGEKGPWYKTNIYSVSDLGSSAGVQRSDTNHGFAYLDVVTKWLDSGVTAHEFGHALHFHQRTWVYQTRTGAWWETVANWVSETYMASDICAPARAKVNRPAAASIIEVKKLIGDSFQVIVDGSSGTGNYYQAWPFLTYLTNNPDNIPGLGRDVMRELMVQYKKNSNETPLHTLARVANTKVGSIVGSYWARMAYVDIGHAPAQKVFQQQRGGINYKNVALQSDKTYKVLPERQPRYMGCNIIPLTKSGATMVQVDINLAEEAEYTATFAVRDTGSGSVRYETLEVGSGSIEVSDGEEISLVVANTPADPILYDGFKLTSDVQKGLDYSFTLSGATA